MAYTQEIYVNVNTGNDTTGDGTSLNPVATIAKALTKATTTTPIIYLANGTYSIATMQSLCLTSKTMTYMGMGIDTTIEVANGTVNGSYAGNLEVLNCIMTARVGFATDARALSYSSDTMVVNFRNVYFKRSSDNKPTTSWFYTSSTADTTTNRKKSFYNCTFDSVLNVCGSGTINVYSCATENTTYGNALTNSLSVTNAIVEDNICSLTNYDNKTYGIYSGDYKWVSQKFVFYSVKDSKYYTIDSSKNIVETTISDATTLLNNSFKLYNFTSTVSKSQVLKDISPFKIFALSPIGIDKTNFIVNGIKDTKELVVSKQVVSTTPMKNIVKFSMDNTITNNGDIKIVVSNDGGNLYKTWNGSAWVDLVNTIANKEYSIMNTAEKTQWETFKNEVYTSGMSSSILAIANFNLINNGHFRFAYVINNATYSDDLKLKYLKCTYDEKDKNVKVDSDVDVSITENYVKLTSIRDIDNLTVNILT